jgi:UDP-N-acetylglucosamine acyltransferase
VGGHGGGHPVSVDIHPTAIVAKGAELADGVSIGPYSLIGEHARIGARTEVLSHVIIEGHTRIGEDCTIRNFSNLGGPPHHTAYKGEPTELIIGDRNRIWEHVTMHIGTVQAGGVTRVGDDGMYMATCHVGHDCTVGNNVVLAHSATLGGHVDIGDFVMVSGLAAVHQYCRVGRYSFIGGLAAVTKDVIPYGLVWGNHAHLEGLNLVGLKRRDFSRETIGELRSAYRLLFAVEGTFQERIDDTAATFGHSAPVMEIIDFIRAEAGRPLCLPEREV